MKDGRIYPFTFRPVLKHYLWGGRNLEKLGRNLPPGQIAESWEIAAHDDGTSLVSNGPLRGKTLVELHQLLGLDLIGQRSLRAHERGKFPLLIKLLDANKPLSVQVHPDDNYAQRNEGDELGKTEMWVVLQAKPGAEIILGVKQGTTRETFRSAITEGRLGPYLHRIKVKTGDHICIPAGSLHAIMDGLLLAEIQQNSNTTYRVYDWNRVGANGKPRALHIKKALDVIRFEQIEPILAPAKSIADKNGVQQSLLCANEYFTTEQVEIATGAEFHGYCRGETFEIWGALSGKVEITTKSGKMQLAPVSFTLLPAVLGEFRFRALSAANLLRIYVGI